MQGERKKYDGEEERLHGPDKRDPALHVSPKLASMLIRGADGRLKTAASSRPERGEDGKRVRLYTYSTDHHQWKVSLEVNPAHI